MRDLYPRKIYSLVGMSRYRSLVDSDFLAKAAIPVQMADRDRPVDRNNVSSRDEGIIIKRYRSTGMSVSVDHDRYECKAEVGTEPAGTFLNLDAR